VISPHKEGSGNHRTVLERWHPVRGWLGRLVAERRPSLFTGEAVEQLAENLFVVLETNETLSRVRRPPFSGVRSRAAPTYETGIIRAGALSRVERS
jgi:hypothetical protein